MHTQSVVLSQQQESPGTLDGRQESQQLASTQQEARSQGSGENNNQENFERATPRQENHEIQQVEDSTQRNSDGATPSPDIHNHEVQQVENSSQENQSLENRTQEIENQASRDRSPQPPQETTAHETSSESPLASPIHETPQQAPSNSFLPQLTHLQLSQLEDMDITIGQAVTIMVASNQRKREIWNRLSASDYMRPRQKQNVLTRFVHCTVASKCNKWRVPSEWYDCYGLFQALCGVQYVVENWASLKGRGLSHLQECLNKAEAEEIKFTTEKEVVTAQSCKNRFREKIFDLAAGPLQPSSVRQQVLSLLNAYLGAGKPMDIEWYPLISQGPLGKPSFFKRFKKERKSRLEGQEEKWGDKPHGGAWSAFSYSVKRSLGCQKKKQRGKELG